MEKLIPFLVKRIKKVFLKKWIGKKLDQFDINVFGTENISKFKNGSFVLASNHLLSKDGGLLKSGISSDSFIIRKVVFHETGKKLAITASYILEWPFVGRFFERFTKVIIKSFNSIPVGKGHNDFHNVFLREVDKVVSEGRPILIYPVGKQKEDFEETDEIRAGAGYIALRHKLPIVPVYIKGANLWKPGQKIYLYFGKSFDSDDLTIDKISERIKEEILKLKNQVNP